jgi:putative membrane protein insertion efficiency factor
MAPNAHRFRARLAYLSRSGTIALLGIYHNVISPLIVTLIGPACRFEPTCSEYAAHAIGAHGAMRGGWMVIKRFLRCRPGAAWGYDPVIASDPSPRMERERVLE